ncbi:hypothetical protein TEA_010293 [Camellia sinensis var. sinensis]|uniref:Exostosin GT47 domain-containing protein n=1 Tax=Camellia sinensis var. sinensis TaxID=542762 RepID=A0A4S4F1T7_CAMSN|nr:hypothetical protein TEA_010293 [Camellia sinensis var. sinensis]
MSKVPPIYHREIQPPSLPLLSLITTIKHAHTEFTVPIDFVLFQPNSGIVDPVSNLHYDNMLFAQIDAVCSALASLGFMKVPLQISKTGWPSKGDEDEAGANIDNGDLIKSRTEALLKKTKAAVSSKPIVMRADRSPRQVGLLRETKTKLERIKTMEDEDSEEYGSPVVLASAIADLIKSRTEALLKKTKAAVSFKPIVMRAEYAHCPAGIFDIKWSPVGAIVGSLLAQADADGYLRLHHLECCSDGSAAGGNYVNNKGVFHDRDIFLENYKEMNKSFKIYVYPHKKSDPFAHVFLPVDFEPRGNYASESYFRKVLMKSHFITMDPSEADLFFLPFSIARLRHDPRVGVEGIQDFIRDYIFNISQRYPYWNRTGGADHFYVACHSIGRSAMGKADEVKLNAIQVVCSSSYFLYGYVAHKDASLPQIWPRQGEPPDLASSVREKLAFFAGSINSPVRENLLETWKNDSEIFVHFGRLTTPYDKELLGSKYCLHVKGFEVNTARIGDALYYGCVPVIIANHYDLPFSDILNWERFSIIVATLDIPLLKEILKGISFDEYLKLQRNVLEVRNHFQWHVSPVDYDAFYMVMYELWLRRSLIRVPFSGLQLLGKEKG